MSEMLAPAIVVFGVTIGILVLSFFLIACLSERQFLKQEEQKNALFRVKIDQIQKEARGHEQR